ncbi:MAG: radical SAM family heme chaperone HemW [Bacteroidota bacterium]
MSGIYLHIPFCKQACHYCDFHFATSLKKKEPLLTAIAKELALRKAELEEEVQTIYFGGGTPSLLTAFEIEALIDVIREHFVVTEFPEVTLEANPDDLSKDYLDSLADTSITRLSIGVQSFFEEDLRWMNRAHNAREAMDAVVWAKERFENLSLDLIYGIPGMSIERWEKNLAQVLELQVPHLSCYALTVEPRTALHRFIEKGVMPPVDDTLAQEHHRFLIKKMERAGYDNYEFSNFGKPGFYSENNMAYWHGESYLGVGPSAHSFDGERRSWNVANNAKYIQGIEAGELPLERETLSTRDRYNEYVMTRLRTMWGISLEEVQREFGTDYHSYLLEQANVHVGNELLEHTKSHLIVTPKGKFLSDGIASDLFRLR